MDYSDDKKIILIRDDREEHEFIVRYRENILAVADYREGIVCSDNPGQLLHIAFQEAVKEYRDYAFVIGGYACYFDIADRLKCMGITDFMSIPEYEAKLLHRRRKENNIFLLLTPDYGNIGDQAIATAETILIKNAMPEYELMEIDLGVLKRILPWMKKIISPSDKIYITGGGFAGSLWMDGGESYIRRIICDFPDNEITIFPQSLFFEHNLSGQHEKQITKRIYGSHKNLKLILREKYSYDLANQLFDNPDRIRLLPDVVLSMQYDRDDGLNEHKVKIAGICLKWDKESLISELQKQFLSKRIRELGYEIKMFSTQVGRRIYPSQRNSEIQKKLDEISGYDLVITDCLHGMLFCAITGTPCIALDQISHKVRGEYKWISHLPFIHFENSIEDINSMLLEEIVSCDRTGRFCYDEYSAELTEFLGGDARA